MNFNVRQRVSDLRREGKTKKEILKILFEETGKEYSPGTIKAYYRLYSRDLTEDNAYMIHCKEEYASPEEEECFEEKIKFKGENKK